MPSNNPRSLHCRWEIRRDLPAILAIEAGCPAPWAEEDYLHARQRRDTIAIVVEDYRTDEILGVMVYQLFDTHLKLRRLAVRSDVRRTGVGRLLVERLVYKVTSHRREAVYCLVPEDNLGFQLFLRSCGFMAEAVVGSEYLLEFRPSAADYELLGLEPPFNRAANRIAARRPSVFSAKIKELRAKFGITQRAMADAIGTSSPTINDAEHGREINLSLAMKIAKFFGLSVEEIWQPLPEEK